MRFDWLLTLQDQQVPGDVDAFPPRLLERGKESGPLGGGGRGWSEKQGVMGGEEIWAHYDMRSEQQDQGREDKGLLRHEGVTTHTYG